MASLVDGWEVDSEGINHPLFRDWYLDTLAEAVNDAARFKPDWNRDWSVLAMWLRQGIDPEQILGAIRKMASVPSYKPRTALEFYNKQVTKFRVKP